MAIYQVFNKRIGAWIKVEKKKKGLMKIVNVKEANPKVPFKGIRRWKKK